MFVRHLELPNVVIVPVADKGATWEVFVAWQRGKTAARSARVDRRAWL